MFARVLLLRSKGALIRDVRDKPVWDHGIFTMHRTPRRFELRDAMSAPGCALIMTLYMPEIRDVDEQRQEFVFRGFEQVGNAAVCQDWAVVFGGSQTEQGLTMRQYNGASAHSTGYGKV
jgi:hypothetical protein